jgi:hypothetical protein
LTWTSKVLQYSCRDTYLDHDFVFTRCLIETSHGFRLVLFIIHKTILKLNFAFQITAQKLWDKSCVSGSHCFLYRNMFFDQNQAYIQTPKSSSTHTTRSHEISNEHFLNSNNII